MKSESRASAFIFLAHFLFILAAWTLVIKFIFPIAFAVSDGSPILTYVMWDFWWVVHIALGISFLKWKPYTFIFALITSIAEISIIVYKFVFFLAAPEWTIWRTNWFINKIFVLASFVAILLLLLTNWSTLRDDQG